MGGRAVAPPHLSQPSLGGIRRYRARRPARRRPGTGRFPGACYQSTSPAAACSTRYDGASTSSSSSDPDQSDDHATRTPALNLTTPGWACTDDVRAISAQRLTGLPLGTVTDEEADEIRTYLRLMIDL
ncbi:hypothetical protein [Embleya sp. AB8]|uniref:hypothetical protein n=1 Tax=Embleya sp. AB8 TaxID=3156304 RepID=UPI003C70D4AD